MNTPSSLHPRSGIGHWLRLAAFIIVLVAVGSLIGTFNVPGEWYRNLDKPVFNPPDWVFGPVWTILYIMIGIAGWRVFERAPKSPAMMLWALQLVLNWVWPPMFFGAENLALALGIILPLMATIIAFMVVARGVDKPATWLFVPYAAWVAFATVLNASLLYLN